MQETQPGIYENYARVREVAGSIPEMVDLERVLTLIRV